MFEELKNGQKAIKKNDSQQEHQHPGKKLQRELL